MVRIVKQKNGCSCFCCHLWNCNVVGALCIKERGCVCECPKLLGQRKHDERKEERKEERSVE